MHGLVVLDKNNDLLYNSIIWCDSRAVKIGQRAESELENSILENKILNSPGNFIFKIKVVKGKIRCI